MKGYILNSVKRQIVLVVTTSDFNLVIYNCDSNRQSPVISGVIPLDLTLPGKNMSSVMKIFYVCTQNISPHGT